MTDKTIQEKLREKYNPDGSDLRRMQLRMLEILKYIDKICKENDIKYWLSSGTCLGAVRHGGFIPWDDDVDIEMLKPDYKRLRKVVLNDKESSFYWQDCDTDEYYPYVYAKLRDKNSEIEEAHSLSKKYKYKGLFVDVFIMTPSNSRFLRRVSSSIYIKSNNFLFSIKYHRVKILCRYLLNHVFIHTIDYIQHVFANGRLRHISGVGIYNPRKYTDVKELKYIKFEDTEFPVPKNVESYLTGLYGDYNILPNFDTISIHIVKYSIFN